jgi:hypothetical protein
MNKILVGLARGVRFGLILAVGALVSACGGDEEDDVYCCAIRHVASRCSSGASADLQLTIAGWQQVGNSENPEACKALIENDEVGCGNLNGYTVDIADGIVQCS